MSTKSQTKNQTIGWLDVALWLISVLLMAGLIKSVGSKKQAKPPIFKSPIRSCRASARVEERLLDGGYQHLIYLVHDREMTRCVQAIQKQELHYVFFQKEKQFWRIHVAIDHAGFRFGKKRGNQHPAKQKSRDAQGRKKVSR